MTKKEHEKRIAQLSCGAERCRGRGDPAGQHQDGIQADKRKVPSGSEGRQRKPHCQIAADRLSAAKGTTGFEPKGLFS